MWAKPGDVNLPGSQEGRGLGTGCMDESKHRCKDATCAQQLSSIFQPTALTCVPAPPALTDSGTTDAVYLTRATSGNLPKRVH